MENSIDEFMGLVGTERVPIYHYYITKNNTVKTIRYDNRNGEAWQPIWRSDGDGDWSWSTYEIQEEMRSKKAGYVNHQIKVAQVGGQWKGKINFLVENGK